MQITLDGMTILVKELHAKKAPSPMRALKKSPFLRTKTENAYDL